MSIINFDRYCQIASQRAYIASYFHPWYLKALFHPTLQTAMDAIALFHFIQANECEMIYHLFSIAFLWLLGNSTDLFICTLTKCCEMKKIHFFPVFRECPPKVYSFFSLFLMALVTTFNSLFTFQSNS